MATTVPEPGTRLTAGLRRQLGAVQTVSVSVGVMAPTLAMSWLVLGAALAIRRAPAV